MSLPRVQLTVRAMMLLTVATALAGWLYLQTLRQEVGRLPCWHKAVHPDPRRRARRRHRPAGPGCPGRPAVSPPVVARSTRDEDRRSPGGSRAGKLATVSAHHRRGRRRSHGDGGPHGTSRQVALLGLLPVAGEPEVAFHPVHGLRVEADGFETWVKFLNDVEPDDGRRIAPMIPLPVTVRLKPWNAPPLLDPRARSPSNSLGSILSLGPAANGNPRFRSDVWQDSRS